MRRTPKHAKGGAGRTYSSIRAAWPCPLGTLHQAKTDQGDRGLIFVDGPEHQEVFEAFSRRVARNQVLAGFPLVRELATDRVEGRPALIYEWCEAIPLSLLLETGPLAPITAAAIVVRAAEILHAAWDRTTRTQRRPHHLIHGDLGPDCILLTATGEVRIWGLGLLPNDTPADRDPLRARIAAPTPWTAPESHRGVDLAAGDVYALSAVLCQAITGEAPSFASAQADWHDAAAGSTAERVREKTGISALSELVAWCLSFDPHARPTAREMAGWLEKVIKRSEERPSLVELASRQVNRLRARATEELSQEILPIDPGEVAEPHTLSAGWDPDPRGSLAKNRVARAASALETLAPVPPPLLPPPPRLEPPTRSAAGFVAPPPVPAPEPPLASRAGPPATVPVDHNAPTQIRRIPKAPQADSEGDTVLLLAGTAPPESDSTTGDALFSGRGPLASLAGEPPSHPTRALPFQPRPKPSPPVLPGPPERPTEQLSSSNGRLGRPPALPPAPAAIVLPPEAPPQGELPPVLAIQITESDGEQWSVGMIPPSLPRAPRANDGGARPAAPPRIAEPPSDGFDTFVFDETEEPPPRETPSPRPAAPNSGKSPRQTLLAREVSLDQEDLRAVLPRHRPVQPLPQLRPADDAEEPLEAGDSFGEEDEGSDAGSTTGAEAATVQMAPSASFRIIDAERNLGPRPAPRESAWVDPPSEPRTLPQKEVPTASHARTPAREAPSGRVAPNATPPELLTRDVEVTRRLRAAVQRQPAEPNRRAQTIFVWGIAITALLTLAILAWNPFPGDGDGPAPELLRPEPLPPEPNPEPILSPEPPPEPIPAPVVEEPAPLPEPAPVPPPVQPAPQPTAPPVQPAPPPVRPAPAPVQPAPRPVPTAAPAPRPAAPQPSPAPSPAPAPTSAPRPAPAPAPSASTPPTTNPSSFRVVGDAAEVRLVGGGQSYTVGQIPPGSYRIMVAFEAGAPPTESGVVLVNAGESVTISCAAAFLKCKVR